MTTDVWTEILIDHALIESSDPMQVIEPVWWLSNIYEGAEAYERSLQPFSRPQRFVFGMCWFEAEVCNGGHHQFYANSTGIVWRDALAGFEAAHIPEVAAIIEESVRRFGGMPFADRERRQEQVEAADADFDDLDDAYYALLGESVDRLEGRIMRYIYANADDFLFHASVLRPPPFKQPLAT